MCSCRRLLRAVIEAHTCAESEVDGEGCGRRGVRAKGAKWWVARCETHALREVALYLSWRTETPLRVELAARREASVKSDVCRRASRSVEKAVMAPGAAGCGKGVYCGRERVWRTG